MNLRYKARIYRHELLKAKIIEDIRVMLYSLLRDSQDVMMSAGDWEQPGFPFAPHNKFKASVDEWVAFGETQEAALIKLLAAIYGDACWYPKT